MYTQNMYWVCGLDLILVKVIFHSFFENLIHGIVQYKFLLWLRSVQTQSTDIRAVVEVKNIYFIVYFVF